MGSILQSYECPSCNKPLQFRHSETNFIVCPSCRMPIQRLEGDVLREKPVTVLNFRNEIIQVGTKGAWLNQSFEVIGRVRFWFQETDYNYWTVLFENGTVTYLAEGYGIYAVYEKVQLQKVVNIRELEGMNFDVNGKQFIDEQRYFMERKYISEQFDIEGEVIMPANKGSVKVYELSALNGSHIEFISFAFDLLRCYRVHYTDYDSLCLTNTSEITYVNKDIDCMRCSNKVKVKTFPYALSCCCPNCGTRIDIRNNRSAGNNSKDNIAPYIGIGTKGKIRGIEYTVVGCVLKEEDNRYASKWVEYVLHNPAYGYAFLSEYDGNFIFVKENPDSPVLITTRPSEFEYGGEPFQLYNAYNFRIVETWGEFPGNIFNDASVVNVSEYISPPEMWIQENSKNEGKNWYWAEHLDRNELPESFSENLPPKGRIGAIEPKGYINPRKLILSTVVSILAVILIHLIMSFTTRESVIFESNYSIADTVNPLTLVTEQFELTKWKSNLEIDLSADIYNSWFELNGTLVNAKTGTEYSFEEGVEYYEGYEGGEHWTEGSRSKTIFLSSLPAGTYFLQLQAAKEYGRSLNNLSLTVKNDVSMGRNLLFIILLLLIWPVYKFLQVHYTERERWYDSPFTPYTYEN